jgi:hypothetical protein
MYFVRKRIKLLPVRRHHWCQNVQWVWFFSFDSLQFCGAILANVSVRTDLWPIYLSALACLFRYWNTERQSTQRNVLSVTIQLRVIETACHETSICLAVRSSEYLSMSPLCSTFQWNVYFQIMPGVRYSSGPNTTPFTLFVTGFIIFYNEKAVPGFFKSLCVSTRVHGVEYRKPQSLYRLQNLASEARNEMAITGWLVLYWECNWTEHTVCDWGEQLWPCQISGFCRGAVEAVAVLELYDFI